MRTVILEGELGEQQTYRSLTPGRIAHHSDIHTLL